MKRRRNMEKSSSEIRPAIEELSMLLKLKPHAPAVNQDAPHIPIKPFLSLCNMVLHVLDKIGPTMVVIRQDINQNIQRLEAAYESNPAKYSNLVEILKKELNEKTSKKGPSCSKAFVWLTRSLDFAKALLQNLARDTGQTMEQAVEESYNMTLKPWHGWIASAAYKVALRLIPDSKIFIRLLMAKDENYESLKEEMQTLIALLVPYLQDIYSILRQYGLDKLKSA